MRVYRKQHHHNVCTFIFNPCYRPNSIQIVSPSSTFSSCAVHSGNAEQRGKTHAGGNVHVHSSSTNRCCGVSGFNRQQSLPYRSPMSSNTLNIVCASGVLPFFNSGIIDGTMPSNRASFPSRSQRFKYHFQAILAILGNKISSESLVTPSRFSMSVRYSSEMSDKIHCRP